MKKSFPKLTIITILCLLLASKIFLQDFSDKSDYYSKSLNNLIVYGFDNHDENSDQNLSSHFHHNHFDMVFSYKDFDLKIIKTKNLYSEVSCIHSSSRHSQDRPPQIVS